MLEMGIAEDIRKDCSVTLVRLKQKGNFGNHRSIEGSIFTGVLYEDEWYFYLQLENEIRRAPENATITIHEHIRNVQYSRVLYDSIIQEIKLGKAKPFSVES